MIFIIFQKLCKNHAKIIHIYIGSMFLKQIFIKLENKRIKYLSKAILFVSVY
jgi:hypothetical protein